MVRRTAPGAGDAAQGVPVRAEPGDPATVGGLAVVELHKCHSGADVIDRKLRRQARRWRRSCGSTVAGVGWDGMVVVRDER